MRKAMSYIRFGLYDGEGFEPEWLETRVQYASQYNAHHKYNFMALESFPVVGYANEKAMLTSFITLCKEMLAAYPVTYEQG